MTDPDLVSRLRHGAANIHSIGAGRAADLLQEAADALAKRPVTAWDLHNSAFEAPPIPGPLFDPATLAKAQGYPPPMQHPGRLVVTIDRGETSYALPTVAVWYVADGKTWCLMSERIESMRPLCTAAFHIRLKQAPPEITPRDVDPRDFKVSIPNLDHGQPLTGSDPDPVVLAFKPLADRVINRLERPPILHELPGFQRLAAEHVRRMANIIDDALKLLKDGERLAVSTPTVSGFDMLVLVPGQDPPKGRRWTVYGPAPLDPNLGPLEYGVSLKDAADLQRQLVVGIAHMTPEQAMAALGGSGASAKGTGGQLQQVAVTVTALKEAGCWQVVVDGDPVPEMTVYAFGEKQALERAHAALASVVTGKGPAPREGK